MFKNSQIHKFIKIVFMKIFYLQFLFPVLFKEFISTKELGVCGFFQFGIVPQLEAAHVNN